MKDQAENLRKIMQRNQKVEDNVIVKDKARVLAVTSGKGGVGKTNFAINLSIALKRLNYKVLILDADIGMANIEILTGVNIKYTVADLITKDKTIHEIISKGPKGINIISGGSGLNEVLLMNLDNTKKVLKEIKKLETLVDFIIIDTGAGISNIVLNFVMAADEVIVVTTPDPTSLMDGYTMIKTLTSNGYKGKLNIVVNIVNNKMEAVNIFNKINKVSNNFLDTNLHFLGYLEKSRLVNKAVINQQPFILTSPNSLVSRNINNMALSFTNTGKSININSEKGFADKLKDFIFKRGD